MEGVVQVLAVIMSFSIGIVAIIGGIIVKMDREKARRKQGLASNELAQKVTRLEKTNAEYAQRLEDLEAIVVSRRWISLQETATVPHEMTAPRVEERNRQQVAELARRLG